MTECFITKTLFDKVFNNMNILKITCIQPLINKTEIMQNTINELENILIKFLVTHYTDTYKKVYHHFMLF